MEGCFGVLECFFYDTFQQLQDDSHLNPLNEVDMYCLHYVFLPRIRSALKSFVEYWNNHPISTERNRALQQATSGIPPQPSVGGTNLPTVQIPRSSFAPCAVLKRDIDCVNVQ